MVNQESSDSILKETKGGENDMNLEEIKQHVDADLKQDDDSNEVESNQAPDENTQSEATWKDNVQSVTKLEKEDDQSDYLQKNIINKEETLKNSAIQDHAEQELAKEEDSDATYKVSNEDIIKQDDIHQKKMKPADTAEGEVLGNYDNQHEAAEKTESIVDGMEPKDTKTETAVLGDMTDQQIMMENDVKQESNQHENNISEIKDKQESEQDKQEVDNEQTAIKEMKPESTNDEECTAQESDYKSDNTDQAARPSIDNAVVDRQGKVENDEELDKGSEKEVNDNVSGSQVYSVDDNRAVPEDTAISIETENENKKGEETTFQDQDPTFDTETENEDTNGEEITSQDHDPAFDTENSTSTPPCDIVDFQSDNSVCITDQNNIEQTEHSDPKHIHQNDGMNLQQEADAVAIRQS